MFSKSFRWAFLTIVLIQISCTPKFGEAPPPQKNLELQNDPCLIKATEQIGLFFTGDANPSDLSESWGCVSNVITEFRKYVRGRENDKYTSQELATFIENNFLEKDLLPLSKKKISPELQLEVMKLKRILVGGNLETLTMPELGEIQNVLTAFRAMSLELNPHMKILSMGWVPDMGNANQELEKFEKANEAIQKFAKDFSALVQKNQPAYSFTDFAGMVRQLENFSGQTWTWVPGLERFLPVLMKVKKALAGGDENRIIPEEWRRFVLLGSRIYVQYLRYFYFIDKADQNNSVSLQFIARTFEDTLSLFQDLVEEKPSGQVSKAEIAEILNAVAAAWDDFKSSEVLVTEMMKIKKTLIGGNTDFWTSKDFERAKLQVSAIKVMVEKIWPYFSVYSMEWKPMTDAMEDNENFYHQARTQLVAVGKELGSLLVDSYSYDDLLNLMKELERLYPAKTPSNSAYNTLIKVGCAAQQLKSIILDERKVGETCTYSNGRPQYWEIKKDQWGVFLETVAQAYMVYGQYHYFIENQVMDTTREYSRVSWFITDTKNVLADWLNKQKTKSFTTEELASLTISVRDGGLLPSKIRNTSISQALDSIFNSIFNPPEDRLAGIKPNALNMRNLEYLHQQAQIWAELNTFIQALYESRGRALTTSELLDALKQTMNDPQTSATLKAGLYEMQIIANSRLPLVLDSESRVVLAPLSTYLIDAPTVRSWNFSRLISRALIRSFSKDLKRINQYRGIHECEVTTGFNLLKGVFEDLGVLSPQSPNFISNRFLESNIFVPHSNGDGVAGFDELSELISMIFSGFSVNSEMEEHLVKECLPGKSKTNGNDKVAYDCLRKSVRAHLVDAFDSMPEYVKYFRKTAPEVWNQAFYENLKAAGFKPNTANLVRIADAGMFSQVIQYTEVLFLKFDANRDGILSKFDAINAFPTFETLITGLAKSSIDSGQIKPTDVEAVFTYILKFGKVPGCSKKPVILCLLDKEARQWLDWKANYLREDYTLFADRNQIAKILGLIADEVEKSNANKPPVDPNKCDVPAGLK